MSSFKVGDSIIERQVGARSGDIKFGVVLKVWGSGWLEVVFPSGTLYSLASHCQPYSDWLEDNGF